MVRHQVWFSLVVCLSLGLAQAQEPVLLKGHDGPVLGGNYSADGNTVLTYGQDQTVRTWDAHTGQAYLVLKLERKQTLFGFDASLAAAKLSPDGKRVLTLTMLSHDPSPVWGKGLRVLSAGADMHQSVVAQLWDTKTGKEISRWNPAPNQHFAATGPVGSVFSPDGKLVATAFGTYMDPGVRIHETEKGTERFSLTGYGLPVLDMAFSPDSRILATASMETMIVLWDTATGKKLAQLKGHEGGVHGLAFRPDGKALITLGNGTTYRFSNEGGGISTSGSSSTTTMESCLARIWEISGGKELGQLAWKNRDDAGGLKVGPLKIDLGLTAEPKGYVGMARYNPAGDRILTAGIVGNSQGGGDRFPTLWDAKSFKPVRSFAWETDRDVTACDMSPDGKTIAVGGKKGPIGVFDAETGKIAATLKGHTGPIGALVFSPDGKSLLSVSMDGSARIWAVKP